MASNDDIIGKRFGNLLAIKFAGYEKINASGKKIGRRFVFKCNCGNEETIRYSAILYRKNKSCKKCYTKHGSQHRQWQGVGEISKHWFNCYQNSAKDRNLSFNITLEYCWDLFLKQNRKCAFSGEELFFSKSYKTLKDFTASLDRIDSTKGYEIGNVQWIHKDLNKLKKNIDNNKFLEFCIKIAKYQESKKC